MITSTVTRSPHTSSHYIPPARSLGSFADHEPSLWRAVITQALMDAASRSAKSEARRAREDALNWLLGQGRDFEDVCENADLDPDYVRCKAREALARGFEWRLPAGKGWRTQARLATHTVSTQLN